ncbi:hypothetical protein F2Q70_00020823 [Brassica cretica]|uniref:Uncharacterized protein n=1 Tax=Brassica cretica TaxID=69181 RepID=A0A8S9GMC6_BRACR|nr:hypothetical protein F2Q70_00020823 [Brassica cretica]
MLNNRSIRKKMVDLLGQKEAVRRYLPFRCHVANPSVRYLRDGTGAEPYNLCFHQPVPHLLFLSWPICFGWDSQGHALPSYGVDNVWSRFHWVLMAGPRLGLPCFACPGIMSVPRSTEAKCLILISSIAKLWQLALISFLDARI